MVPKKAAAMLRATDGDILFHVDERESNTRDLQNTGREISELKSDPVAKPYFLDADQACTHSGHQEARLPSGQQYGELRRS